MNEFIILIFMYSILGPLFLWGCAIFNKIEYPKTIKQWVIITIMLGPIGWAACCVEKLMKLFAEFYKTGEK